MSDSENREYWQSKLAGPYMTRGDVWKKAANASGVCRLLFERDVLLWREHVSEVLRAVGTTNSPYYSDDTRPSVTNQLALGADYLAEQVSYPEGYVEGITETLWEDFAVMIEQADKAFRTNYFDAIFTEKAITVPRFTRDVMRG